MNWQQIVFEYLIFAECTAIVALGFIFFDKNPPEFAKIGNQQKPKSFADGLQIVLKYLLLAPIVTPYLLYKQSQAMDWAKAEQEKWHKINRTFYEMSLEPQTRNDIDDDLWAFWQEPTVVLVGKGYQNLGDFRTKDEPIPGVARFFLSPDGTELVSVGEVLETRYFEVESYLEDGSVVSTANAEPIPLFGEIQPHCYFVQSLPDAELDEVLDRHADFLTQKSAWNSAGVRRMATEHWQDYARYSNRRMGQIKYELGSADAPPEDCEFPRWSRPEALVSS